VGVEGELSGEAKPVRGPPAAKTSKENSPEVGSPSFSVRRMI
jgi:hypothetical protein